MARVVVYDAAGLEDSSKRIHPGPRSQAVVVDTIVARILSGVVYIGAAHAELSRRPCIRAAKSATVQLGRGMHMLYPRMANLLKAIVVARSAAHSIKILRYDGMVGSWQCKNINGRVSSITNGRPHGQADLSSATPNLYEPVIRTNIWTNLSRDDIGSRAHTCRSALSTPALGSQDEKQD